MKHLISNLVLFAALQGAATGSSMWLPVDTNICLKVDGKILSLNQKNQSIYKVQLLCDNKVVDSAILKESNKKFNFYLKANRYYTIKMSANDHMSKLICIDTKNTPTDEDESPYIFAFETALLANSEAMNINNEMADYPVAIIYFDQKRDRFDYNKEYTNNIKKEMYLTSSR